MPRIRGIDAARAATIPGVLGVFTGADCLADGLAAIPHDPLPKTRHDMKLTGPGGGALFIGPHLLLPVDKARHVGEAVAMVVAETVARRSTPPRRSTVDYAVLPGRLPFGGRHGAGRAGDLGRGAGQYCWSTPSFGNRAATDRAFAARRPRA